MPNCHHIISGSEAACRLTGASQTPGTTRKNQMSRNLIVKSSPLSSKMGHKSALIVLIVLLSANGLGAIVNKQQQQARSDDSASVSAQQQPASVASQSGANSGSSNNGNSGSSVNNNGPISYNPSVSSANHQTSGSARSQSASSAGVASAAQQSDSSAQVAGGYSGAPGKQIGYQNFQNAADQMMAAASSPDQSYQAAAQSVNMALANSGIFASPAGSGLLSQSQSQSQPQSQSQSQSQPQSQSQSQSQSQQQQQTGSYNNPSALNPLHYFYYPGPKESGSSSSGSQIAPTKPLDLMAAASNSNQYSSNIGAQSANYPDQYQSQAAGSMQSYGGQMGGPEMAASSQDASYLPQPQPQQQQQQSQSQQHHQPQQPPVDQQQAQAAGQNSHMYNQYNQQGEQANSYQNSQGAGPQSSSSISFNGPSAAGAQSPLSADSAFMNSHLNGHQQAQYGAAQSNAAAAAAQSAQNNYYNQLSAAASDLSTSNYGSLPSGSIGSIASYMAPPSQAQQQQQQHDALFGGQSAAAAFNSAASQLSPAAIAPPSSQQQPSQQASSSLFSAASSLFGSQQQQQSNANNYLGNQHYLSSFLTPQQYTQLTGQQIGDLQNQQQALYGSAVPGPQALGMAGSSPIGSSMPVASAASANPSGTTAASSKRFGLSSLVMPVLALAGLSLLIPTMSNIGTAVGRRKRSIVEEKASVSSRQQQLMSEPANGIAHQLAKESAVGEYLDKLQRYYSIYQEAVSNDDCMNRLICEFGDAVKDVTGNGAMIHVAESLAPSWMKIGGEKMQVFKEAASSSASSKEKCKKYSCQRGSGGNGSSSSGSRQH